PRVSPSTPPFPYTTLFRSRLAGVVDDRELPSQPHDLAALGDHRLRVAARLRTLALEELLGVERSREASEQRRRDEADESARGCRRNHVHLPDLRGLCRGYHLMRRAHLPM